MDHSIRNISETIVGLEVRVGGFVVHRLNPRARYWVYPARRAGFDRTREDQPQMGNIGFSDDNLVRIKGCIGPILYENYMNLPNRGTVAQLVRLLTEHRTNNPNETVVEQELKVESVAFYKHDVTTVFSLLEEATEGLSTE